MKNTLTCVALLLCSAVKTQAQALDASQPGVTISQITTTAQASLPVADTGEGGSQDRFNFYNTFWQDRVVANDSSGHTMFQEYYYGLSADIAARQDVSCTGPGFSGDWQVFGPDSTNTYERQGKIDAIWADPTTGDTLLAGCTGGLFESTDGGNNWHCITDNSPLQSGTIGICHIAVNPLNHNTIFLGTGMLDEEFLVDNAVANIFGNGYGAGILESFDGGNTWNQEIIPTGSGYNDTIEEVQRIFFTPDSTRIYAFSGNSVYTRPNSTGGVWVNITPPSISPACAWWDLQFLPGDQNHFFISNNIGYAAPQAGIWEADTAVPSAADWNKITAGFSDTVGTEFTPDSLWFAMDMSVPDGDTLFFIALGIGASKYNTAVSLYKYNITGSPHTIIRIANDPLKDFNPTQYKFKLIVSHAGTSNNNGLKNMYLGFSYPYQSHDGGHTFDTIGQYGGSTHGDIRDIYLQTASNTYHGNGDQVFFATDGGVSKKPTGVYDTVGGAANVYATTDISGHGLSCAEFWGIDMSWDGRLMVGGEQHDGMMAYEQDQNEPWADLNTIDAATAGFDNAHSAGVILYTSGTPYQPYITETGGGRQMGAVDTETHIPDDPGGSFFLPIYIDPSGNQYVGSQHLYELKYDSSTWSNIGATYGLADTGSVYIRDMVFSRYDTALTGYVLFHENKGGQQQFEYINPALTVLPNFQYIATSWSYPMTSVTMDPSHPQKVWVGLGGINTGSGSRQSVGYSPDAGSTWYNVSNGLPLHVPVTKLVFQEGDSDVVFCATDAGIYRCNFSTFNPSAINYGIQWTCFNTCMAGSTQFPNTYVTDMKINYCQQKLYVATYGRAIWVSDLNPTGNSPNPTDTFTAGPYTLTTNQYVTGGMEIENGATVTLVGDTIFMPKNGIISIEAGGHLICNGCVITNSCDQCFWQGIQLKGSPGPYQQTAANDGWVTIENNGVIANAVVGVTNYNGSGGIVQATNSSFTDCNNDVTLSNYLYIN